MANPNEFEERERRFYVLARAYCRNGTVNGSREQRLTCALVELRDRMKEQFWKVAKSWQVSAQELRRYYSCAYPPSRLGDFDPLCLEHACEGVMTDLRSQIQTYAEQFGVPDDVLEEVVVDWLVSDAMGKERTPSAFFLPEAEEGSKGETSDVKDVLPSVRELIAARPREAGDATERPADARAILNQ